MDEPLLSVEDIHAGYGPIEAIRGITLSVRRGEIVTIIGANGARQDLHIDEHLRSASPFRRTDTVRWRGCNRGCRRTRWWAVVLRKFLRAAASFPDLRCWRTWNWAPTCAATRPAYAPDLDKVFGLFPILQ